jgi:hypothetical protein
MECVGGCYAEKIKNIKIKKRKLHIYVVYIFYLRKGGGKSRW